MTTFYLLNLSTRGGWVVQNVQNSVYVVIEWPLILVVKIFMMFASIFSRFLSLFKLKTSIERGLTVSDFHTGELGSFLRIDTEYFRIF